MQNLEKLVLELCKQPTETGWLEFKHSNFDPEMIGKDISALANSAARENRVNAYMIWGIHNETHAILGTDRNFQNITIKGQELESFLRTSLSPNASYKFDECLIDNKRCVVLTIEKAVLNTVQFHNAEYIRIGSYTKLLNQYPAIQAEVWDKVRQWSICHFKYGGDVIRKTFIRFS